MIIQFNDLMHPHWRMHTEKTKQYRNIFSLLAMLFGIATIISYTMINNQNMTLNAYTGFMSTIVGLITNMINDAKLVQITNRHR